MNNTPFVSVVIPTFNRVHLLRETVESVRGQSFRDFEIIVVNDGSTDGTSEWLAAQSDLVVIEQANAGIAASRNAGIAAASGEYVAFLDHDDLWRPEKLAVQTEFARSHPEVALIAVKHVRLGRNPARRENCKWLVGDLFAKTYTESFIHTSGAMIRKDVLLRFGGFPTRYRFADEFDVWLGIAKDHPIAYLDDPLVFIRFYEHNTSHNRVGVRTDTYDILMKYYDPTRIPLKLLVRALSDHDISFGRAYVRAGDTATALKWFRKSLERTPFRFRSLRYYWRYWLAHHLRPDRP